MKFNQNYFGTNKNNRKHLQNQDKINELKENYPVLYE